MAKNRLTNLKLDEISLVDSPANKGARIMMMKRDDTSKIDDGDYPSSVHKRTFTAEERRAATASGAAMEGGRYPIENAGDLENAIKAVGRGKGSHAAIRAHIESRAKSLGLTDKLPDEWKTKKSVFSTLAKFIGITKDGKTVDIDLTDETAAIDDAAEALKETLDEISADGTIVDKSATIAECFNQFAKHIGGIVPEAIAKSIVSDALAEHGFEIASDGAVGKKGEDPMTKAIAKSLGLEDTATEAEITAEITKRDDEAKAALAKSEALAKMSGKHKSFMENDKAKMPKGGKDAFAAMSADERDKHMSDNSAGGDESDDDMEKSGNLIKMSDGTRILKSVVGADVFKVLKAQRDENKAVLERLEKSDDERSREVVVKRVAPLTYVGKADEVGALIHGIAKHDKKLAEAVEATFSKLNGLVAKGKLFDEIGGNGGGAGGDAYQALQAKAEELRKSDPKLSPEMAFAKVYEDKANREIVTKYKEEKRQAS